jgi:hypothetical protein
MEAIVSSPIHTLMYAPRRAREQAQQLPTLPAAPQIELPDRGLSGDFGMLERQLALNPDALPEPPRLGVGRIALLACGIVGVAAGLAWPVVPYTSMPRRETVQANFPSAAISVNLGKDNRLGLVAMGPEQPNREVDVAEKAMPESKSTQEPASSSDQSELASSTSAAATVNQPPPAQVPVPVPVTTREPAPQQAIPDFVTRHLDRDESASMLQRADDLIEFGDLSSARLLLRRVAEAGDARAAFTLAGTFDPNVLKAPGLQDGVPDLALARLWYERAAQLGSADAPRRLQQLATASVP